MLTSISLFGSANAGEVGVSGTAKATYNIESGGKNAGKGLGITNELNFTASGETDAGYTWSYSMELDPGATAVGTTADETQGAQNDDTKVTLSTPYGTVGVFISEGGLDVEDAASQSAYSRPTDMGGSDGVTDNFTIDAYNNMQYHTPADMIPFGGSFKIGYAPDLDAYGSGNNAGPNQVENTIAYAINDDLTVSYEKEESKKNFLADQTADVTQKSTGIQLAYNLGGMTLAIARNSHDNPSYSSTAADLDQTLIAVTMAF